MPREPAASSPAVADWLARPEPTTDELRAFGLSLDDPVAVAPPEEQHRASLQRHIEILLGQREQQLTLLRTAQATAAESPYATERRWRDLAAKAREDGFDLDLARLRRLSAAREDPSDIALRNLADLDAAIRDKRTELADFDAEVSAGHHPIPAQHGLAHAELAHAQYKVIGSRRTARARRHVRQLRAARVLTRARGRGPSGRPRGHSRTRTSRAGPSDDPGEPAPGEPPAWRPDDTGARP